MSGQSNSYCEKFDLKLTPSLPCTTFQSISDPTHCSTPTSDPGPDDGVYVSNLCSKVRTGHKERPRTSEGIADEGIRARLNLNGHQLRQLMVR